MKVVKYILQFILAILIGLPLGIILLLSFFWGACVSASTLFHPLGVALSKFDEKYNYEYHGLITKISGLWVFLIGVFLIGFFTVDKNQGAYNKFQGYTFWLLVINGIAESKFFYGKFGIGYFIINSPETILDYSQYIIAIIIILWDFFYISKLCGFDYFEYLDDLKNQKIYIETEKEQEKILLEEQEKERAREKEKEEWEEQLRRKVKEEKKLLKVRNKAMMETYKNQIDLMIKYKEEGANIDKEIIAMRENLLAMENQENETMIKNLMDTLNGL